MSDYPRDLVGYGATPPRADWPDQARIAVQFVINYEEGGECCVLHGDNESEAFLSEIVGAESYADSRHMNMESLYEYGSRAGFWRLHRLFTEQEIPVTVFAVAMALQRNPQAVAAMLSAGWEIASHGYRWIDYQFVDEQTERQHLQKAIEIHEQVTGSRPLGWYLGRCSPNSHRIAAEYGGFVYNADTYADDLPYWDPSHGRPQLMVPYTLDVNDMRFATAQGFNTGDDFYTYLKDTFDCLYAEGATRPAMMSVGLHCRLAGRPGRAAALARFLDYIRGVDGVWLARRIDIARHWISHHPCTGADLLFSPGPGQMKQREFLNLFGGVYEHSSWIAERLWRDTAGQPPPDVDSLAAALATIVDTASAEQQMALIRDHPDLAGRAALAGQVTAQSRGEQASAGLDQCSADELQQFQALNQRYKAKFGFPFIMAVKGANRHDILAGFSERLDNDHDTELARAIAEIHKIARLRLAEIARHG